MCVRSFKNEPICMHYNAHAHMYIIADPLPRSEILRVDWDELPEIYAVTI